MQVKRTLPINFIENDRDLFNHELEIKIGNPKIHSLKNVYIRKNKFYRFNLFEFKSQLWKMGAYTFSVKIKVFIKNLLFKNFSKKVDYEIIENGLWVIDDKSSMYFHWMLDSLQRLELFKITINNNNSIKLLLPESFYDSPFVKMSLDIYNIETKILKKDVTYKVSNLIVPNHLANSGNFNPKITNLIRKRYLDYLSSLSPNVKSSKKIWITRQNARFRKITNFDEIKDILIQNNFDIHDFDKTEYLDQLKIVSNAEVIGGIHGAGLSNMLLMTSGKKVIEVRAQNDNHDNCYFSLASALDLSYYYFLASVDNIDGNYHSSDYHLDKNKFMNFLKKIA